MIRGSVYKKCNTSTSYVKPRENVRERTRAQIARNSLEREARGLKGKARTECMFQQTREQDREAFGKSENERKSGETARSACG